MGVRTYRRLRKRKTQRTTKSKRVSASKGSSIVNVKLVPLASTGKPIAAPSPDTRFIPVGGGASSSSSGGGSGSGGGFIPYPSAGGVSGGGRAPGPDVVGELTQEMRRRMQGLREAIDEQGLESNRRIQAMLGRLTEDVRGFVQRAYQDLSGETFEGIGNVLNRIADAQRAVEQNGMRVDDVYGELQNLGQTLNAVEGRLQAQGDGVRDRIAELATDLQGRLAAQGTELSAATQQGAPATGYR
jgi:hypothetical protein